MTLEDFDLDHILIDDAIYVRIRYLISLKTGITYIFLTILQKSMLIVMILSYKKNTDFA